MLFCFQFLGAVRSLAPKSDRHYYENMNSWAVGIVATLTECLKMWHHASEYLATIQNTGNNKVDLNKHACNTETKMF